jgi:hypothetical protein
MTRTVLCAVLLMLAAGCSAARPTPCTNPPASIASRSGATGVQLISLAGSLEPLKARFNADRDKLRFVAIVSPT